MPLMLSVRLRTWTDRPGRADVWLIQRCGGSGTSGLMRGEMTLPAAEALVAALGLPVERENVPAPEANTEHAPSLFAEVS